jgi:hypothetical protein
MKKMSKVVTVVAILALAMIPTFAQSTATLSLSGTVAKTASITLDVTSATCTNLDAATTTTISVGTLTEICNCGYTVTAASAKVGYIVGATLSEKVPYALVVGGTEYSLTSSATVASQTAKTGLTGATQAVSIKYTGIAGLAADTYSDTVTFTIAATN